MTVPIALFLGLLQGATELFPVSSLGHAVVVPAMLRLDLHVSDQAFVAYLAVLHLGTAAALLVLYRDEWVALVRGFVRAGLRGEIREPYERLAMQLAVATVPVAVVGVIFQKPFERFFGNPSAAAAFLIVNGGILLGAELLRRRDERLRLAAARATASGGGAAAALAPKPTSGRLPALETGTRETEESLYGGVAQLSYRTAMLIGFAQVFALFPGISRSGITLAAGLVGGLRHEEALRFTFLLATPVILGTGLTSFADLNASGATAAGYVGGVGLAGLAAYASARYLIRYFHVGRLDPYAGYCAVLGVVALVVTR